MNNDKKRPLTVQLRADQRLQLRCLLTSPSMGEHATLEDVVSYILASVCDGIRRPGSWECGIVSQMFGEWAAPMPPCCSICDFDLIDQDEPLEVESGHCETCLSNAIDEWCCAQPEDDPSSDILSLAMGVTVDAPIREQDWRAARELLWDAMGRRSGLKPFGVAPSSLLLCSWGKA